jgi:hypothetical protein
LDYWFRDYGCAGAGVAPLTGSTTSNDVAVVPFLYCKKRAEAEYSLALISCVSAVASAKNLSVSSWIIFAASTRNIHYDNIFFVYSDAFLKCHTAVDVFKIFICQ